MIGRLADRQHGTVGRRQLLEHGLSVAQVEHRVSIGLLIGVHHGVYNVGHDSKTPQARWMGAVLACGPSALLSHVSAARLLGLDRDPDGLPHVTVVYTGSANRFVRPGIRVHRTRAAIDDLRAVHHGIPVTSVERTLLDLAATVPPSHVRRCFEAAAERLELLDLARLAALCEASPGRKGTGRLRALAADHRPLPATRSELERAFLRICDRSGIPRPAVNVPVEGIEVDCVWMDARLVVELDGWGFHRGRAAFEGDRRRDASLQLAGYRVVRVTHRRLTQEPDRVVAELRALLATGAHL